MTTPAGTIVGVHLIMNVYDVSALDLLTTLDTGKPASDSIIRQLPLTVLQQAGHQFQPQGYTLFYLLSESHYSIHTYPEFRSCYIDIFCCHSSFDPLVAVSLVREVFGTNRIDYHILPR